MADSFNLNKIPIFLNVVKNTKSRDPQLEFRDVVGAQSLSIPSFVCRFVGKLVINLVDNKLPLVLSERLQIRDCFECIFDAVHGRSEIRIGDSQLISAVRKHTLRDPIDLLLKLPRDSLRIVHDP